MTQQEIEIEGLPEGWKAVSVDATGCNFDSGLKSYPVHLKVEKIQPRRIVLEETEEKYLGNQIIEIDDIEISILTSKLWREVKEVKS